MGRAGDWDLPHWMDVAVNADREVGVAWSPASTSSDSVLGWSAATGARWMDGPRDGLLRFPRIAGRISDSGFVIVWSTTPEDCDWYPPPSDCPEDIRFGFLGP